MDGGPQSSDVELRGPLVRAIRLGLAAARVDAVSSAPHAHDRELDAVLAEGGRDPLGVERPALAVRDEHDRTPADVVREEALRPERIQRVERRGDDVHVTRRRRFDGDRARRRVERCKIGGREECRQHTIGEVPTPTGMSPRRAASSTAFRFASVRRVGPPGLAAAAIDREVSRTTSACASVRARSDVRVRSAGCVAASARRPMTAVITSRRRRLRIGVAGRPRTRRARATRRSPSASAASGRATRTMSTAPSGVKKVREIVAVNIPARESRHPRRSARSRAAGRRSSARGEHRGPRPRAARLRG